MKKYPNDLIGDIMKAFGKYADRLAFVIEDTACTYGELATCVQKISSLFKDREDKIIGIVAENRLETYASILSALICGKTYDEMGSGNGLKYPLQRTAKIGIQFHY